ncbi:MAG TPA: hypothetical protein DD806_06790 [Flavobacterium sp.]|nr:hypothetical protein [Flavobacterium sp.]
MAENQNCCVGIKTQTKCHQLKFTKKKSVVNILQTFESHEIKILILRSGTKIDTISTICEHHRLTFFEKYPMHQSTRICSNPQNIHEKVNHSGLREISTDFCTKIFETCQIQLVPGQKLCTKCRRSLNNQCENSLTVKKIRLTEEKESVNNVLSELELTPIKLHGLNRQSRTSYTRNKIKEVQYELTKKIVDVTGAPEIDLNNNGEETEESNFLQIQQDSKDLMKLMEAIKEKISTATYQEKVQLLTLIPESWTLSKVVNFIPSVTIHMVRNARILLKDNGILTAPEKRVGNKLDEETVEAVENIYQDDEYSRQLPGL